MNPLIFLSYSSKDKLIADAICSRLENQGIRCWIAPRDVNPGADYSNQIADALESATTMVMVFSSDSNNSRHVKSEIDRAFSLGKIIIPFRVENVELDKGLAYYLAKTHWLDAVTRPLEQHIDRLATTIRQISGTEAPEVSMRPPPPAAPPIAPPAAPAPPNRMPWIVAGAVGFCAIAGAFALVFLWLNQRKPEPPAAHAPAVTTPAVASSTTAPAVTPKAVDSSGPATAEQDMFEGTWKIAEAETMTGNPYTGTVEVQKKGSHYDIAWRSTASTASGIGLADGNRLCVAWGSSEFGVVFYKIGGDGTLRGRWTATTAPADASPGVENLIGGSPAALEGEYVVKGLNPGGTAPYDGKLQILKTGRTYQVKWMVGDVVTEGIGIRIDDGFFVAWGADKKPFGVAAFIIEAGQAKGRWTLAGASQTAPENWKR
jgi:hypothetical protein